MSAVKQYIFPTIDLARTGLAIVSDPTYDPLSLRRNRWLELGLSEEAINHRIQALWSRLLHDPNHGFTLQTAEDEACFYDTGNTDVRTEGQSYAMLLAAMLGDRPFFDNVWRWSLRHMYLTEGPCRGYFAWSVPLDGRPRAEGPAPDGEEFFILALIAADKRWGSSEYLHVDPSGQIAPDLPHTLNYKGWARQLLTDVLHREPGEAGPLWQDNNLIAFIPDCGFTDPSYHLPHAYELFAEYAEDADQERWREIAGASRAYLSRAAHPETGLFPEYAHNDGTPELSWGHGDFYSDAYRCMINLAVDALWNGPRDWQVEIAERQARLFATGGGDSRSHRYALDGTPVGERALHPTGLTATAALTYVLAPNADSKQLVEDYMALDLREGKWRYYDNLLYVFSYLVLGGRYTL